MQRNGIYGLITFTLVTMALAGCGGGGDGGGTPPVPPAPSFAVTGTVVGLLPGSTVLLKNGADTLSVAADGSFTMPAKQAGGSQYQLVVATQPAGQNCGVFGGQGLVPADSSPVVEVTCDPFALVAGSYYPLKSVFGLLPDGNGNVYVADAVRNAVFKVSPRGAVTLFAGIPGQSGATDGATSAALFSAPIGIVQDSTGNLYVSDSGNATIRKISSAGVVLTLAGAAGSPGYADGAGAAARFTSPGALAIDTAGALYTVEQSNNTVRKIKADGTVSTLTGAPGACGVLCLPDAVAVDASGNVYVTSAVLYTITKIGNDGKTQVIKTMFGKGLAANAAGQLYRLVNPNNGIPSSCVVCRIDSDGTLVNVAGNPTTAGSADGIGIAATFGDPKLVAMDKTGNLYVYENAIAADTLVRYSAGLAIRKVGTDGRVSTLSTSVNTRGYANGTGAAASFFRLAGIARDGAGNLYVSDTSSAVIRKISPDGVVSTLAGTAGQQGNVDDRGPAARFYSPGALVANAAGTVYVLDALTDGSSYRAVAIRKITADGTVSTIPVDSDGLNFASGITLDEQGNLYIADTGHATIVKVAANGVVSRIAGTNYYEGDANGQGANARFKQPSGIAVDKAGNVYVADRGNGLIRKIAPSGVVTTVAGTSGAFGYVDGQGSAARFNNTTAKLTIDGNGNLYLVDDSNETVRKIDTAGVVTTVRKSFPFGNGAVLADHALYGVSETAVVKITLP